MIEGRGADRSDRMPDIDAMTLDLGSERLIVLSFPAGPPTFPERLTPAEREIADLIFAGCSNAQIARTRRRSIKTVTKQVATMFAKVGVTTRAAFVARGLESSWKTVAEDP
jgi:DNA-binding NarL/FixJ family response regulator